MTRPSSAQTGNSESILRIIGSLRRSGAKRRAEECSPSNSQPMCECQRPLSTPRQPGAPLRCGLCGSPSSSVKVWCLRWSATQWMTAPWTDIEPRIASVARSHGLASKERCVKRRWKPIVTPKPTSAYMTARIARSRPVTAPPHRSQSATMKPRKGSTTATTVIWRSSRAMRRVVMGTPWHGLSRVLWTSRDDRSEPDLSRSYSFARTSTLDQRSLRRSRTVDRRARCQHAGHGQNRPRRR